MVWGRGALDMKGGVAMLVDAFLRAARGGLKPRGDLILCVLADEEDGGDAGAKFLCEEHAELFDGVRHALGEFGGFSQVVGGRRLYPIQVAEKQICWLRAVVRGPGGHASMPQRGGTMGRLARFLRDLDGSRTPVHVTPVARAFVEGMADALPRPQAAALRGLLAPRLTDGLLAAAAARAAAHLLADPPQHGDGDDRPRRRQDQRRPERDRARARRPAAARLPAGRPDPRAARRSSETTSSWSSSATTRARPSRTSPGSRAWAGSCSELDPEAVPLPLLMPGVTDGRFFGRLGIQTYGFLPLRLPADFKLFSMIHAADERVPADAIRFGAEAVGRAVERYAG